MFNKVIDKSTGFVEVKIKYPNNIYMNVFKFYTTKNKPAKVKRFSAKIRTAQIFCEKPTKISAEFTEF